MSKLIMEFAKTKTFVGFLGESNSVKYKVNAAAISKYSALPGYLYINDSPVSRSLQDGINVFKITNNSLAEQKVFSIVSGSSDSTASAFVSYMSNAQTDSYYVILTGKNFVYTDVVFNWMNKNGSSSFPIQAVCNDTYASAYAGIYSGIKQTIVNESVLSDDSNNMQRAYIQVVYDDLLDQGATGLPKKLIYSPTEYVSSTDYEFVRYPENTTLTANLSDYSVKPGDTVCFSGSLFASSDLIKNNMTTRASLRIYQGSNLLSVTYADSSNINADQYTNFEQYVEIPANADSFVVVASRYPRNDSVTAIGKIKNLVLTEVSVNPNKNIKSMFGVNGLKASRFIESNVKLPEVTTFQEGNSKMNLNNVIEEDYYLPDYILRTNISAGHIPYESEVDRPGTACYFDKNNILTNAEYNEARVDWYNNKAIGILVEKSSTNLFTNSANLKNIDSKITDSGIKYGTYTVWNIPNAVTLTGNNPVNIQSGSYSIQFIVSNAKATTIQFGVRLGGSNRDIFFTSNNIGESNSVINNTSANLTYTVKDLSNGYFLYQLSYTPESTDKTISPYITTTSGSLLIPIVQLESGYATSFIPGYDNNAVTRSSDSGSFNISPITGSVLYKYVNSEDLIQRTEIIDYKNAVPSFTGNNFKSGWVVETSIFNRILSDTEKDKIRRMSP